MILIGLLIAGGVAGYGITLSHRVQQVQHDQVAAARQTRDVRDANTCNSALGEIRLLNGVAYNLRRGARGRTAGGQALIAQLEVTVMVLSRTRDVLRCPADFAPVKPLPALPVG